MDEGLKRAMLVQRDREWEEASPSRPPLNPGMVLSWSKRLQDYNNSRVDTVRMMATIEDIQEQLNELKGELTDADST